jgi:hypothetical protein
LKSLDAALASLAVFAAGCSTEATAPPAHAVPKAESSALVLPELAPSRTLEVPTIDSLVLLGSSLAPGMREVTRGEGRLPLSVDIPGASVDTCLRAVVAAGAPVVLALLANGRTLALSEAGVRAVLDAHGPVCLTRGIPARLEAQGPEGIGRYVIWAAP